MTICRPAVLAALAELPPPSAQQSTPAELFRRVAVVPRGPPEIRIQEVGFRYREAGPDVVRDLSFTIPAGAIAGVVGPSGSGKSTLLALVLGLARPSAGTVTVGGVTAEDFFRSGGPTRVGYVGAEPAVFAGTVRENLLYGRHTEATDADLMDVLERVALRSVVGALPGGLAFLLGERGVGLSTGERQRLALARALLAYPDVLVLDEATASVDSATEAAIGDVIEGLRGKATCIVCAHRSELLRRCAPVLALGHAGSRSAPAAVVPLRRSAP
jgi:ABC-type multidrug transport system fused ATPase/permease subunit